MIIIILLKINFFVNIVKQAESCLMNQENGIWFKLTVVKYSLKFSIKFSFNIKK